MGANMSIVNLARKARLSSTVMLIASLIPWPATARSLGDTICSAAASFLARERIPIQDGMVLIAGRGSPTWSISAIESRTTLPPQFSEAYLAYFMSRSYPATGAVSAKISLAIANPADKTNYVDVYRPAIEPGTNSCERRGRATIDRRVRVNQYIDYHDPNIGTLNSTLEDFHFRYPRDDNRCARTNDPSAVRAFQFEGVDRTQGDTFVARTFSITGTAFAIGNSFSTIRSELHYRPNVDTAGTCVGFSVPLGGSPQASVVINEHGFGGFPSGKRWLIAR